MSAKYILYHLNFLSRFRHSIKAAEVAGGCLATLNIWMIAPACGELVQTSFCFFPVL